MQENIYNLAEKICLTKPMAIFCLDSPNSELHVSAGYVNSSAVAAEVFRVTNGIRETDALVALRLNNSRLLHSRLHWRPNMIQDLKVK